MRLSFRAVLFLLFCSVVSATQFYTERGELCISECATNGRSYYWCWTGTRVWNWGYCSPVPNTDRLGTFCSGPCDYSLFSSSKRCRNIYGQRPEYCGTHQDNFQIISSYYKHYCRDACESRNTFRSYYTCTTDLGWDYCSPQEGKDLYNRRCDEGTYCELHRDSTYRCLVDGRLEYCSIKRESKEIASNGYYCTSECLFDATAGRFQCSTADGSSGFCSPDIDIDSHGRVCDNSQCVKTGDNYQCKYDSSANLYDDCGIFSFDNEPVCPAKKRRRKRVPSNQPSCEMVHSVRNNDSNLEIRWTMEVAHTYANSVSCSERKAATSLIEQLKHIDGRARTLATPRPNGGPVRIDLQGTFSRNGRHYRNIQVQQNRRGGRGVNRPTTIATALVQSDPQGNVDIPIHYVRDALLRSLRDCDTVESCTNNYGRTCRLEIQPRSGK